MRRSLEAVTAALLLSACAPTPPRMSTLVRETTEASNKGFSDWTNKTTNLMIEKYGPPDHVETLRLVWEHRGPWKKIIVWDELGMLDNDYFGRNIEGIVAYEVPEDKRRALASFSRGLFASTDGTELSARSSSEERNFLMLNLADEIVKGGRSPEDARLAYLQTLHLADTGKSSPLMQALRFQTPEKMKKAPARRPISRARP